MEDNLVQFLSHFKLSDYLSALNDQGADNLGDLRDLNEEEANEIAAEVFPSNKPLHKKKFLRAWKQLRDGEYPPNPEEQKEIDTIMQQLNQKIKVIQTTVDDVENDTTERIKELQSKFQAMTETLNNHKKALMNNLMELKAQRKDKLNKNLQSITSLTAQCKAVASDSSLSSSEKAVKIKDIMSQNESEPGAGANASVSAECKILVQYDEELLKSQLKTILNVHMDGVEEEKSESVDAQTGYTPTWSETFKGKQLILSDDNATKVTLVKEMFAKGSVRANQPIIRGQITKWIFEAYLSHDCVSMYHIPSMFNSMDLKPKLYFV